MDIANLIPEIAKQLGIAPSTLLFLFFILTTLANVTARKIPQDAAGWLGTVRKIASLIGAYVPSNVTSGVSVTDVARAALLTPPITQKVDALSPDSRARTENEPAPATRLVKLADFKRGDHTLSPELMRHMEAMRSAAPTSEDIAAVFAPQRASLDTIETTVSTQGAMLANMECKIPPAGWYCTRGAGHPGPCAAHPVGTREIGLDIPGDALSVPIKPTEEIDAESLEFQTIHAEWQADAHGEDSFVERLEKRGWEYVGGQWHKKKGA